MTFQHDADGVPLEGTHSGNGAERTSAPADSGVDEDADGDNDTESANPGHSVAATAESPQHSRALLAITAAGTLAVAPVAGTVLGPAGGGDGAHSSPVFLLAEVSHDIGHNDWAFQGGLDDRIIWVVTYVAIALAWLGVTFWMRTRDRRAARAATATPPDAPDAPKRSRLWLRTLTAALVTEFAAGVLTIGAGLYAQWTATAIGPVLLRLADVCSPWWSCVAALVVVARAERNTIALRAAIAYGAVLALVLLVPLPGPSDVKALILAATAALPALLDRPAVAQPLSSAPIRPRSDAAAAG